MPTYNYKLADGSRVPGVTTIIGRFKNAGPLMYWAWEQGRNGKDFRETRDAAAEAGTLAHLMVECDIRKKPFDPNGAHSEILAKARQAFEVYREWKHQTKLEPLDTEVSLVSEEYRFGGTLDAMLIQDKVSLGDWKTSNGVYQEYLIQLAAYGHLWNTHFPDMRITGGFHLLRFSKENADFAHYYWSELDDAWEAFKHMRALYDLDKKLKARLG